MDGQFVQEDDEEEEEQGWAPRSSRPSASTRGIRSASSVRVTLDALEGASPPLDARCTRRYLVTFQKAVGVITKMKKKGGPRGSRDRAAALQSFPRNGVSLGHVGRN